MLGFGSRKTNDEPPAQTAPQGAQLTAFQQAMTQCLNDWADGLLDRDISTLAAAALRDQVRPELVEAIHRVAGALAKRASDDLDATVEICIHSNEASISGARLIAASTDQSTRCQSLASASVEMQASVKTISEASTSAATEASAMRQIVDDSVVAVRRTLETMTGIARSVNDTSAKIHGSEVRLTGPEG